jgi:hypothetical protein
MKLTSGNIISYVIKVTKLSTIRSGKKKKQGKLIPQMLTQNIETSSWKIEARS